MYNTRPLHIAACGWDHPGWGGRFYPLDLPPEWRLTYYANEFDAVLLPPALWSAAGAALAQWAQETVPGFRFYLEWDGAAPGLLQALASLGERCGGVVATDAAAALCLPAGIPACVALAAEPAAALLQQGVGCCWGLPGGLQCAGTGLRVWRWRGPVQPRPLRDLIEVLGAGGGGALLVLEEATPEALRDARTIANLLGV